MQFTALATLAFADVDAAHRSSATTISSMSQQLSMVFGVAIAAGCLNLFQLWRGAPALGLLDFQAALLFMGAIVFLASLQFLVLERDAGAEVSGHRPVGVTIIETKGMSMTEPASAVDELVWGHGPRVFEVFLEPTCPYSARTFNKLDQLLADAGEDRITLKIRLHSQPWHMFSGVIVRAVFAAATLPAGKGSGQSGSCCGRRPSRGVRVRSPRHRCQPRRDPQRHHQAHRRLQRPRS